MTSDLKCGVVTLRALYVFTKNNGNELFGGPAYKSVSDSVTEDVAEGPGFYLWGRYDKKKYWHSIYLGKAGFGSTANLANRTNLKKRIREELKDERAAILRSRFTPEELHVKRKELHGDSYASGWNRAMEKAGTTHILWVATPLIVSASILSVEADLIEGLNPKANKQRPTPPATVQNDATAIFEKFRELVHSNRRADINSGPYPLVTR